MAGGLSDPTAAHTGAWLRKRRNRQDLGRQNSAAHRTGRDLRTNTQRATSGQPKAAAAPLAVPDQARTGFSRDARAPPSLPDWTAATLGTLPQRTRVLTASARRPEYDPLLLEGSPNVPARCTTPLVTPDPRSKSPRRRRTASYTRTRPCPRDHSTATSGTCTPSPTQIIRTQGASQGLGTTHSPPRESAH